MEIVVQWREASRAALCAKVYSLLFCLQRPWLSHGSWLSFSSLLCFQSHFSHNSPSLHSSNDTHAFLESTQREPFYFKIFNTITYVKILSPNFKIKSLCPIDSLSVLWWFLNSAAPRTSRPSESYLPCRSACLLISRLIAVSWSLFVIGWSSADC